MNIITGNGTNNFIIEYNEKAEKDALANNLTTPELN
jgi:hypothetical protein